MNLLLRFKRAYNTFVQYKPEDISFQTHIERLLIKTSFGFGFYTLLDNFKWWKRGLQDADPVDFQNWWDDLTFFTTVVYTPWTSYRCYFTDDADERLSGQWYEIWELSDEREWDDFLNTWVNKYTHSHDEWITDDGLKFIL